MPKVHGFGKRLSFLASILAFAVLATASGVTFCQETQSNKRESPAPNEAAANAAPAAKPAAGVVEEPPIYYVRDKDGLLAPVLGISLDELRELLRQKKSAAAGESSPKYSLQQIVVSGDVRGDHVELTAEYKIQTLDADWVSIPLVSAGAVLSEPAEYHGDGKQMVQYNSDTGSYTLRLQGGVNSEHQLKLKFMVPIKSMAAQHRLEFTLPNSAASHLAIRLPQSPIELMEFSGCAMAQSKNSSGGTTGGAEIEVWGAGGPLTLVWKDGASDKSTPVLEATGQVLARIDSRSVQFDTLLSVRSFGTPFEKFRIKLPKGAQLTGGAPNGAAYTLTAAGAPDTQLIDVQLPQKTTGPVDIRFQAESAYDVSGPNTALELAGFEVLEAAPHRQWGHIAVAIVGDWQPTWGPLNRVRQIAELPEPLRRADVVAGFEYLGQGASLKVRMTPRKTRIAIEPEYTFFVEPRQLRLEAHLKYTIHGAKTSSLEIALPGWQIDELGPEGAVDGDAELGNAGPVFSVPLLHPTSGELEVTIKAHRDLAADASHLEIAVPIPAADVLGPALMAVVPADNIRLAPKDGEQQGLTRPTVPPRMKLPPREQSPLFYRAEQPQAIFVGTLERLPQVVRVSVESNLDLRHDGVQVEQTFHYHVEHEPVGSLTLEAPKSLVADPHFELLLDGHPLAHLPAGFVSNDDTRTRIEAPLLSPRTGAFEVVARYWLPQDSAVFESGQRLTIALVTPTGVAPERHRLNVQSEESLRFQASGDAWEVADEPLAAIGDLGRPALHLKANRPASEISLVVRPEERNASATVIDRAWVQTWISGSIRQQRAVYQFTTTNNQFELSLPAEVSPNNIEVRLDHQLLAAPASNSIKISVPSAGIDRPHILELRYQFENATGQTGLVDVEMPRMPSGIWIKRMYWQLVLPGDQHLIGSPAQLSPEFTWNWNGCGWSRRNVWQQTDLEDWIGATRQDPLPQATNRYLFSITGNPASFAARTAARWQIVFSASAIVLIVGLLLLQVPAIRKPWVLFAAGVILLALSAWLPDAAVLFSQAAALGMVLLVMAVVMQRLIAKRRMPTVPPIARTESSIFQRSSSPLRVRPMSLAGASTTTGPGEVDLPPSESQEG